ncbi:MAG: stage II sporulation protein D [Thermoanaerobacteraceae bacterium]|nr:stage II sporulation protein D [Thermoanaerobacteraceae bacterium]
MRLRTGLLLLLLSAAGVWFYGYPGSGDRVEIRPNEQCVRLYRHVTGEVQTLPLEEYVTGVVAAEMPALFPVEALKAQAVAARTYVLRRVYAGGVANNPHPGVDVCDDPRHSQAYLSRRELKRRWGLFNYYRYYYRIRRAVGDTAGLVIVYQGQLIDPVYHASCGGRTENAADIWKFDVPYLKSVPCPYDANPRPVEVRSFTLAELVQALLPEAVAAASGGNFEIALVKTTSTGRPKEVAVNGTLLPATAVRERLGLKSARFTWKVEGDRVLFTTVGYGHGVGLCQYGAKGMAEHGYDFRAILEHYYSGVQIVKY